MTKKQLLERIEELETRPTGSDRLDEAVEEKHKALRRVARLQRELSEIKARVDSLDKIRREFDRLTLRAMRANKLPYAAQDPIEIVDRLLEQVEQ
jgi:exonuclease VII small subunit